MRPVPHQHLLTAPGRYVFPMPKTRSGKIMRRVLAAISNEKDVGDVTSLANPEIVDEIRAMGKT